MLPRSWLSREVRDEAAVLGSAAGKSPWEWGSTVAHRGPSWGPIRGLVGFLGSIRAGDQRFETLQGFGDLGLGAGQFDEDVGVGTGDNGAEHGVIRAGGLGSAKRRAV